MTNLGESSFYDLLPPNLKSIENRALSYAVDRQFSKLVAHISKVIIYADIQNLNDELCDFLALCFNIKIYDMAFPLETKRKLIMAARQNNSKKGTAKAVSDIVSTIHSDATIERWFEYSGDPFCFKVKVDTSSHRLSENECEKLVETIEEYKSLRSHLELIEIESKCKTSTYLSSYAETVTQSSAPLTFLGGADVFCAIFAMSAAHTQTYHRIRGVDNYAGG